MVKGHNAAFHVIFEMYVLNDDGGDYKSLDFGQRKRARERESKRVHFICATPYPKYVSYCNL